MTIFFTADQHFGHSRMIEICKRPFADVAEMNHTMVHNWNSIVRPEDDVYHLGDFAWKIRGAELEKLFDRLNGTKHLVEGNHDYGSATQSLPWETMTQLNEVSVDGQRIVLCHYPLHEWRGSHRGAIHLHGHVHGNTQGSAGSIDVGVDVWGFRPVSLPEILERIDQRLREPAYEHQFGATAALTAANRDQMRRYAQRLVQLEAEENWMSHDLIRTGLDTVAHLPSRSRRNLQTICEGLAEWERDWAFEAIGDAANVVLEQIMQQRVDQSGNA